MTLIFLDTLYMIGKKKKKKIMYNWDKTGIFLSATEGPLKESRRFKEHAQRQ